MLTTLVLCIFQINAQTTAVETSLLKQNKDSLDGWKIGGVFSANFSQVSLTNWSAGGESSIALNTLLNAFVNYKKGNATWGNSLDLAYGMLKSGKDFVKKTDDKIDFTSKYGQKAYKNLYYAGLINLKSQFTKGYNYPNDSIKISNFLAPAYVLGAIGMNYGLSDKFTLFISPFTMRTTIVNDQNLADIGAFGVDAAQYDALGNLIKHGKRIRSEYGGYLRLIYRGKLMKNINIQNKLELFSNYIDNPSNIDVNWEVLIAMKVNKYISATISTQLIYDDNIDIMVDNNNDGLIDAIGPRVQFKEVIGVGLSYKF